MFATAEDFSSLRLGVGDEVFITGLFTKSPGDSRNIPIVRTGNLSLAADEKIPFGKLGLIDAHLIEGRSIGGLSGSPVFIRQTLPMRTTMTKTGEFRPFLGGDAYYLLGSTIGHWDHEVPAMTAIEAEAVNMGISAVVPASKIHEILFQSEMVEMRKKIEDERVKNDKSAKLDTGFQEQQFTKKDFESALKKASRKMPTKT